MGGEKSRTSKESLRCSRRGFVKGAGAVGSISVPGAWPGVQPEAPGGADIRSQSRLSQFWSTELSGTVQDYLIQGGQVYVATEDGVVRTLDVETGRETNRIDTEKSIRAYGLAKDGQYLAVGLANSRLKIIDSKAFSVELTIPFDGNLMGVTAKSESVFLATTSAVQRISLPDGQTQWHFDKSAESPIWTTAEGLAVSAGGFRVLGEENGETVWKQGFSGTDFKSEPGNWLQGSHFWGLTELESHLIAAVPVEGGAPDEYRFLNKFTGEKLWTAPGGGNVNRAVATSDRVIHQKGSSIVSRNFDAGEPQWETDIVSPHTRGMVLYDGSLVVTGKRKSDGADALMALDPSSRAIKWEQEVDGPLGLVETSGSLVFAVDLETDEIHAFGPGGSGNNTPTSTPRDQNPTRTGTPAMNGNGNVNGNGENVREDRQERGFFTNGEKRAINGLNWTVISTLITVVATIITVVDIFRGGGS